jgi:wobble nucleotide-excising tRNase
VCRKLVESFLSFKFPKQRGDLMALLNAALPEKENDIVRERIYKFINIYSHDKKINVFEELDAEILDANSQLIINDVLNMINNLDPNHYNAMIDKFEEELQCS